MAKDHTTNKSSTNEGEFAQILFMASFTLLEDMKRGVIKTTNYGLKTASCEPGFNSQHNMVAHNCL